LAAPDRLQRLSNPSALVFVRLTQLESRQKQTVAWHVLTGHFRSPSTLGFLVLPMSVGSIFGAVISGYVSAWTPSDALRVVLLSHSQHSLHAYGMGLR
jgi:hypothetical protein